MLRPGGLSVPRQGFDLVGVKGGTDRGHEKGVVPQDPMLVERTRVCLAGGG